MQTIPLELQEHVLDHLSGDRLGLLNCIQVCKAWAPRIRFHLYRTLHIDWNERSRTVVLLKALEEVHAYVLNLEISNAGWLCSTELIQLLESLENLESLSIHTSHGPTPTSASGHQPSVYGIIDGISRDTRLGERLLLAIANMPRLCHLEFGPNSLLSVTRSDAPCTVQLHLARGLRELRSLRGDMFPIPRVSRLWDAIATKKAEHGAAPLLHFGALVGPGDSSLRPLARFLASTGEHLQSLWFDSRLMHMSYGRTAARFRDSGLSLKACKSLRRIEFRLGQRTHLDGFLFCTALLLSVPHDTPLEHLVVSISEISAKETSVLFQWHLPRLPVSTPASTLSATSSVWTGVWPLPAWAALTPRSRGSSNIFQA